MTLSDKKCQIGVPEIEFFGLVYTGEGCKPAPNRLEGRPTNVRETLLGMAQYSAQLIPHFSDLTAQLRELSKSSSKWCWDSDQENAFVKLKECLSEDSVLDYYEVGLKTKLMVDAGPNGLGLILFQEKPQGWKPVVCFS